MTAVEVTRGSQILDTQERETEPRFADRLTVGCERKKGVEDDSRISGPRNWKESRHLLTEGRLQEAMPEEEMSLILEPFWLGGVYDTPGRELRRL